MLKRILGCTVIALVLALAGAARADSKYTGDRDPWVYTYEPAVVSSGAAVTFPSSGALDTKTAKTLSCNVRTSNEAGGASRVYIPTCTNSTGGTTTFTYPTTTLLTNTTQRLQFGGDPVYDPDLVTSLASGGGTPQYNTTAANGLPSGVTYYPGPICRFMKFTAAAANGLTQIQCELRYIP
ncbi:MAG TPA: hypothetical protein VIU16_03895 [Gaiellaceae bacterium]